MPKDITTMGIRDHTVDTPNTGQPALSPEPRTPLISLHFTNSLPKWKHFKRLEKYSSHFSYIVTVGVIDNICINIAIILRHMIGKGYSSNTLPAISFAQNLQNYL